MAETCLNDDYLVRASRDLAHAEALARDFGLTEGQDENLLREFRGHPVVYGALLAKSQVAEQLDKRAKPFVAGIATTAVATGLAVPAIGFANPDKAVNRASAAQRTRATERFQLTVKAKATEAEPSPKPAKAAEHSTIHRPVTREASTSTTSSAPVIVKLRKNHAIWNVAMQVEHGNAARAVKEVPILEKNSGLPFVNPAAEEAAEHLPVGFNVVIKKRISTTSATPSAHRVHNEKKLSRSGGAVAKPSKSTEPHLIITEPKGKATYTLPPAQELPAHPGSHIKVKAITKPKVEHHSTPAISSTAPAIPVILTTPAPAPANVAPAAPAPAEATPPPAATAPTPVPAPAAPGPAVAPAETLPAPAAKAPHHHEANKVHHNASGATTAEHPARFHHQVAHHNSKHTHHHEATTTTGKHPTTIHHLKPAKPISHSHPAEHSSTSPHHLINGLTKHAYKMECGLNSTANLIGGTIAAQTINYFIYCNGDSVAAASAWYGNLNHEDTGLDPTRIEHGLGDTTNPADAGPNGWGIAQWTPGSKATTVANEIGVKQYTTLHGQLYMVSYESKHTAPTGFQNVNALVKHSTDPRAAAAIIEQDFEGALGGGNLPMRQQDAVQAAHEFHKPHLAHGYSTHTGQHLFHHHHHKPQQLFPDTAPAPDPGTGNTNSSTSPVVAVTTPPTPVVPAAAVPAVAPAAPTPPAPATSPASTTPDTPPTANPGEGHQQHDFTKAAQAFGNAALTQANANVAPSVSTASPERNEATDGQKILAAGQRILKTDLYYGWGAGHESTAAYNATCTNPDNPPNNQPTGGPYDQNPSPCALDCSSFVFRSIDNAFNLDLMGIVSETDGTMAYPEYWKEVTIDEVIPGDVATLIGHVEMIENYDPATGNLTTIGEHKPGTIASAATTKDYFTKFFRYIGPGTVAYDQAHTASAPTPAPAPAIVGAQPQPVTSVPSPVVTSDPNTSTQTTGQTTTSTPDPNGDPAGANNNTSTTPDSSNIHHLVGLALAAN